MDTLPSDSPSTEAASGVAAVDRALSIVAALEATAEPMALADLSRRTGLYKSTILRLLASLERAGYTQRLADGSYGLGPMAWRLGRAYDRSNPLRTQILPVLQKLVRNGTESASFHIRHDVESRLCLFRVDSHHATLDRVQAGQILPMRGAAGRILLAFESETVASTEDRIAISYGERDPSCAGIATPVFGADGRLHGAVSLSGPRERFTEGAVAFMRAQLLDAADAVTAALGGAPVRAGGLWKSFIIKG